MLLKQCRLKVSLKQGDQVTVEGYLSKDGTKQMANARRATLPDAGAVLHGAEPSGREVAQSGWPGRRPSGLAVNTSIRILVT